CCSVRTCAASTNWLSRCLDCRWKSWPGRVFDLLSGDPLERWTAAMLAGDFERAWQQTDQIELGRRVQGDGSHLLWNGSPFNNKAVLVRCCHGLGDTIQFLRYLPLLRRTAKRLVVEIQPELRDLFLGVTGIDLPLGAYDAPWDIEIECMELPYA